MSMTHYTRISLWRRDVYNLRMILGIISLLVRGLVGTLRLFGSGGTALPGLWVEKYVPWLISMYARQYDKIILITGTNGKTTTQLALLSVLETAGLRVVANTSGSNMLRGVATVLMTGGLVQKAQSVLMCEVEEATMPRLTRLLDTDIIVVTNMYRDQLDAYGELDKTVQYIKEACQNNPNAILVLNSDDPVVTTLSAGLPNKKVTYSLGEYAKEFQYEGSFDKFHDTIRTSSQNFDIVAKHITVHDDLSTESEFSYQGVDMKVPFKPPGKYNVYNLLACYATAQTLDLSNDHIMKGLTMVQAPFGRGEVITFTHKGRSMIFQIFLVKNPAGYSQVWDMLSSVQTPFNLMLGLSDQIADGRDVSWIWDIDLAPFPHSDALQFVAFTGRRAYDMALRLKYAGVEGTGHTMITNIQSCLDNMVEQSTEGRRCFVLMTYTAMNEFRSTLGKYVTMVPYSL